MNKRQAKAKSLEGKLSIGDLRAMIDASASRGGSSSVNKDIPHQRAIEVYRGAFEGRDDSEVPKPFIRDIYRNVDRPSRDSLIICNILRDCAD
jgi:hypothetical protein